MMPNLINLRFLGKSEDDAADESGGLGIGGLWFNCFGSAVSFSLSAGLETVASQAYGAQKYSLVGVYYQRCLAILMAFSIPVITIFIACSPILQMIGIEEGIAILAGRYVVCQIPSHLALAVYESTKAYLHAQNIWNLPTYIYAVVVVLHVPISYFFIKVLNMDVFGAAIAKNFTDILAACILIFVMKKWELDKECSGPWTIAAVKEWGNFLAVTGPMGLISYLEWFCFEIYCLQAGRVGDKKYDLVAHLIMATTMSFINTVPLGLSTAVATFVGNAVGEGSASKAKRISFIGFLFNLTCLITVTGSLFIFRWEYAEFFTDEYPVQMRLIELIPLYMTTLIVDGLQVQLSGILKGVNKQDIGTVIYIVSMYLIGQPVSLLLAFTLNFGVFGLWEAYLLSLTICLLCFVLILRYLKWHHQVIIAVSYTHLRAHETRHDLVCRLLLEKKKGPAS
eukprot:TRINITY_DN2977_c0_g1_i1.p1 TRINITY_DN2977_c0_g1~~TRINITY_DN2977_c0_g1_i1.p1  ORF type:complete len:452 (+),score=76.56 TRINITY_DN2977_c0_g1_i1:164-1519(+)